MKMLPHCHPVEALAFTTEDHTSNVVEELQKKISLKSYTLNNNKPKLLFDLGQIVIF